ncbi:hypothetical protein HAX54_001535 [Datura stramonium]|uniref:Uncharacterized protein n=1 Tax=Datura stramonium TaxID=4076 RepID=A0ABS8RT01_DATST|nr:hypothetical protein [Datura stramonium]
MVKGKQAKPQMMHQRLGEIRALIDRFFGEVNARMDKFDQTILELKEKIESSKAQGEGGKGVEFAMNASLCRRVHLRFQEEENMKSAENLNRHWTNGKHDSLIEDDEDVVDVPIRRCCDYRGRSDCRSCDY